MARKPAGDRVALSPSVAQLAVRSVTFVGGPETVPIPLREPQTMTFLTEGAAGAAGQPPAPVAFVGGTRPSASVVFARPGGGAGPGPEAWRVRAVCPDGPGIAETDVYLSFDATGNSRPCVLELDGPLPPGPRRLDLRWQWQAGSGGGSRPAGVTRHEVLLAWRTPLPPAEWGVWSTTPRRADGPPPAPTEPTWVYLPIMRWTCEWAAGRDSRKSICDAILAKLPASDLAYAQPAWSVGDMLRAGGGYCGGWYRMLQAMAGAQGIPLLRRTLFTDWRVEGEQARWCAIVVAHPGLNRSEPADPASRFHDVDRAPLESAEVLDRTVRRYRFWGSPGGYSDGHCVNFLRDGDAWWLYDACFLDRPARLDGFDPPEPDPGVSVPVNALGGFKEAYLDGSVDHMMGTLRHDGQLYSCYDPPADANQPSPAARNGLTVRTAVIPNRGSTITFRWGP